MSRETLKGRRVLVGVCGSIAAYRACDVISQLRKAEADIRVVATESALQFIGLATLRSLAGQNISYELFGEYPMTSSSVQHVSLGDFAEVMVIVGATANTLGKVTNGVCDSLLTTVICASGGKVIFAPAMNWRMWENPVTQRNVRVLRELGYGFVGPDCGSLACGETGSGRLCSVDHILDATEQALGPNDSKLRGKHVLITSGPTREWLDPVRFISNPSSGKMGFALASEALCRGARVTVISGPTAERPPWGAQIVPVETTEEMAQQAAERCAGSDVVIGAAAPADFRPVQRAEQKIKKTGEELSLTLTKTTDILAAIGQDKGNRVHVGFAAESENLEQNALAKLEGKNLDLIVANDITAPGSGFGSDTNEVTYYSRDGGLRHVPKCSKREVAAAILDEVERLI